MFKFESEEIKKVQSAIDVCFDHGLYEAAEALEEDLAREKFVEVIRSVPWAGKCLGEACAAGVIKKDSVPQRVFATEYYVSLDFDAECVTVEIRLDEEYWHSYDPDRDPEWDLENDDDDEPSDWEREYNLDGRCDDED